MTISKKLVEAVLDDYGNQFTIGEFINDILKAVENNKEWVFYHPKIMTTAKMMELSVVMTYADNPILSYEEHINAIHNRIYRLIADEVCNEKGRINEDSFEELRANIQYLRQILIEKKRLYKILFFKFIKIQNKYQYEA